VLYPRRQTDHTFVGYEVLIAVVMRSSIFWGIKPYNPLKVSEEHVVFSRQQTEFCLLSAS
jgi:hypothetical protein